MSNIENTVLLEFAYEVAEEITNHPSGYDTLLLKAIEKNDLKEIGRILKMIEDELHLSQNHFRSYDLIGDNDVY